MAITATADFTTAATNNYRDPRARVEVSWSDAATDTRSAPTVNDDNRISYPEQVIDQVEVTPRKWAYLNGDIKADGTRYPMPDSASGGQVGWYGATSCGVAQTWAGTNPLLTHEFSYRPITEVRLAFDTQYAEYAEEFTIRAYSNSTLLHTEAVTGNSSVTLQVDLSSASISSCNKLTLEIVKWSKAEEIVKVIEFFSAIVDVYYGDDIVKLDILEEMETEEGSIPIGNISSNEISLTLSNENGRFSYGNTNSQYHNVMKKNRKIRVWLGFVLPTGTTDTTNGDYIVETIGGKKVGYQPYGVYWSMDWKTSARSPVVTTTARDRMELLRKLEYDDGPVYENITLYDLAENVLKSAANKIVGFEYEIDPFLTGVTVPVAWFPKQSYFKTIKQICIISTTTAYTGRDGVLKVGDTII